ncbi:autotransporter outer membrane beta-barrel domain-containing protein [Escherichia coli]|nr:autotransporter outer membrane beta-barrel domain-containing protein [Escherichia coli]EFA4015718.1 autotransporter outer membrane beta-barrel domain-containing protein [Escherichia coli]EFB9775551.1 autotransporter outer membrane beta-barrel domain-containing protein [Escherichia coli]EFH3939595.1 autotransporter outer membrane beta-barrel domain-containing protein [Escherichia coli]EFH4056365.1 autotransporter outer membrane beta-barrel domain-containing protein [Escherichia coli]
MNKIYKLVWNASSGCWSVASEFARKGKPGRGTRRLMLATGLLSVSGAGMAATNATSCTENSGITPKTITCTGENSPYKIKDDNTILIMETGGSITNNGVANSNDTHSLPVLLSNEAYKNNIQIINKGKLKWTEAEPPKASVNSSAAGLLYSQNPEFSNEKDGEILVEAKKDTQGSLSAVQLGYDDSSGNVNFTNNGKVTIETTGPETKLRVYGVRLYGNTLSVSNSGSIVADNQGSNVSDPPLLNDTSYGVFSIAPQGNSIKNTGEITSTSKHGSSQAVYAFTKGSNNSGINFQNTGSITSASQHSQAYAIHLNSVDIKHGYESIVFNNSGKIFSNSPENTGQGIRANIGGDSALITNSGVISVAAPGNYSSGIYLATTDKTRTVKIENSGSISLESGNKEDRTRGGIVVDIANNNSQVLNSIINIHNNEKGVISSDQSGYGISLVSSQTPSADNSGSRSVSVSIENAGMLKGGKAVSLYAGNDSFTQTAGTTIGGISMGDGNNTVELSGGSVTGNTIAGKGNDLYTLTNNGVRVNGNVSLGEGNNTFMLVTDGKRPADAPLTGNLTAGSGNDILAMKNMTVKGNVNLGDGNNVLVLDNSMLSDNAGNPGDITTGRGNDVLALSGASVARNISLGDGDNILAMSRAVIDGAVTAGGGDDRLMFVTDTDADTSGSAIPSDLYTVINNSGTDISLGDGNNTVIMDHDVTFSNGNNSIVTGKGNDAFIISNGKFNSNINAGDGDNTFTVTGGSLKGSITGGSGADVYYQSAGDVVGNLNAGDGFNDITLDGGMLTGNITTGEGDDIIFLSSGKYSGAVNTGAGDDLMYLGTSDASRSDVDISGLTRLDGGDNSDDIGDSLIVLRDLTGSTGSEGKAGDVRISGWENIDIGSEPVSGDNLMARSAVGSFAKTATLSLTGDLDVRSLKINSGSVLNLSDTTESAAVKGNLINAGTIDLTRQSSPSQTLSVTGNYTGSNALLRMNTVWNAPGDALGGNSQSDLLDITGSASGNTTVIPVSKDGRENVIDGDVRQVNHVINTVPVVKVRTSGEGRAFTGTASTTGVSEVQLAKRTSNGVDEYFWTATAVETRDEGTQTDSGTPVSPITPSDKGNSGPQIYNSAVAGYVSMPRVNMEQGYSTVATLHERRGENMALAWNAATPADGQTWGRLLGEHLKQDGKTRLDVHTDTYGFQFGHDFRIIRDEDGAQRLTGGYVAYTRSDSSFYDRYRAEHGVISGDKYAGKGKSEAWSLGVTDTYYTAGGSYLDLVGQFSYLRNHYESRDNVKVSQNGWSGLLSAEAGHPFVLSGTDTGPGWLLEPQVQLAYQYVSLQKFSDGVRDVDQNGQSGLRGRVGARLAWNAQKGAERGTGTFYTLANLNHDFVKPGHVDIGRDSVREKYASTWMETGVGMQLPTGPSGYLYTEARYEKELGHTKRDGWQGTFGYKYTWK